MSASIPTSQPGRRREIRAAVLSSSLAIAILAGCGGSSDATPADTAATSATTTPADTVAASTPAVDASTTPSPTAVVDTVSTAPATIPPGRYVKMIDDDTLTTLELAGLDGDFLRWLEEAGPSWFDYEFTADGHWTQGADECRCGVSKRGDFGTYTYDDQTRLVATSENTDSNGFTVALDWTVDGDVLAFTGITFPDGTHVDTRDPLPHPLPDEFDPIGYLVSTGNWTMEHVEAEATVLDVGMTPGWDSIVDPILAALAAESSGNLQGRFDFAWMDAHAAPDIEQQLIDAVANGELDMAYVATRAFTDRGVTDFDAVSAPFLIGSYDVQQAFFDSDIDDRMVAGVDLPGVTALALAAGPFRYLQGVDRPFVSPADFAGVTFHTFTSPIYAAIVEALGATHTDVWGPDRDQGLEDGTIDLTENTLGWMRSNGRTNHVTIGAALWPATGVLIVNTEVLDDMSGDEVAVLRQVVDSGLPTPTDYSESDAQELTQLCRIGKEVHLATQSELDDLRAAVQPVYDQLDEDESTAAYIAEIQTIAAGTRSNEDTPPDSCTE